MLVYDPNKDLIWFLQSLFQFKPHVWKIHISWYVDKIPNIGNRVKNKCVYNKKWFVKSDLLFKWLLNWGLSSIVIV